MSDADKVQTPDHCGEDVAAYALGALEPAEADAFTRHLETCAVCRDELESFESVIDLLPMTTPAIKAPPKLRRRVRRAIAAEPHPTATQASAEPGRSWIPRWAPRPAFGVAAGLAVIALALVLVFSGGGSGVQVVDAQVTGGGNARLDISGGHAELVVHHFRPPPSGRIYEVWLVHGHRTPQPTSALFGVTSDGNGDVDVPGRLQGVTRVLVTPEPMGGSKVPTHSPVIVAQLS